MKIVILYSGGLDSFILKKYAEYYYPHDEITCIYYAHGAASEQSEIANLPDFVEVRKIDWLGDRIKPLAKKSDPFASAIYIPGRNLILTSLAASQELAEEVWMGTLYDEDNVAATDKNEVFRSGASELIEYVLSPFIENFQIRFPFVEEKWTKYNIIDWALKHGVSKEELSSTVSCWHHDGKPCGRCKQCFKRKLIFNLFDIHEDHVYNPLDLEYGIPLIKKYIKAHNNGTANLDEETVYWLIEQNISKGYISL